MTTLLLTRHGETDWNAQRRWQGHSDPPLNERGREQARELAAMLDGVDVIYASDLARARETAEILGRRLGLEVRLDPRLRERSFGAWEGKTWDELEERFAEALDRWRAGETHGPDDAEPYQDFSRRVESFLEDILARHPGEMVLVVGHGGSIRAIHALAEGLEYARDHLRIPAVPNCGLSRYAVLEGKLARLD
ncbi:MAG TPA: histidine phosphatase family protein [Gaiellaceae bacterium]|nr:histidine phosphatase family protein [Gaiellaceae bacterium]